jgi:hypothetical protein
MASEKQFEQRVRSFFQSQGIYEAGTPDQKIILSIRGWYFKHWGGGYSKAGIPDLLCNINGFFIAVELKSDTGKPSELQEKNITMINQSNGIGVILYPKGFNEFKKLIKEVLFWPNIRTQRSNVSNPANSNIKRGISIK